jgi:hypothetical protein
MTLSDYTIRRQLFERGDFLTIPSLAKAGLFLLRENKYRRKKRMAEKNENEVLNGAETSQKGKTSDENLTAPVAVEFTDTSGSDTPAEPGHGTDKTPENPAPGIAEGDVVIPSNVIDGLFEEKRAVAKEAERKAAEMGTREKDAPAKKGRGGRPPKTPKNEKSASVGGGGIGGTGGCVQTDARERGNAARSHRAAYPRTTEGREPYQRNGNNRVYRPFRIAPVQKSSVPSAG